MLYLLKLKLRSTAKMWSNKVFFIFHFFSRVCVMCGYTYGPLPGELLRNSPLKRARMLNEVQRTSLRVLYRRYSARGRISRKRSAGLRVCVRTVGLMCGFAHTTHSSTLFAPIFPFVLKELTKKVQFLCTSIWALFYAKMRKKSLKRAFFCIFSKKVAISCTFWIRAYSTLFGHFSPIVQ